MALAKGTEQLGVAIDATLLAALREFVDGRGETMRKAVEEALRRHMANPPRLGHEVPLPPVPTGQPPAARGKKG